MDNLNCDVQKMQDEYIRNVMAILSLHINLNGNEDVLQSQLLDVLKYGRTQGKLEGIDKLDRLLKNLGA